MLSLSEGKQAIQFSRIILHQCLSKTQKEPNSLTNNFEKHYGVFVTLHTYPSQHLRGCIGIPTPEYTLKNAIVEATKSVIHDPRFPPFQFHELPHTTIEISILTPPEKIVISFPEEYLKKIVIGKHGLIIEQGPFKGLLLPQVPIEQKWTIEQFLNNTAIKAGLPSNAWKKKETNLYQFTGQIFTELTPEGEIIERELHG